MTLRMKTTSRSRAGFVYILTTLDTIVRQIVRTNLIDLSREAEAVTWYLAFHLPGLIASNLGRN
ncbi:MAG: hypothetical protein IPO07_14705 [Haliscomenobacter sp.]|nr:hypothetical protein [Haliscomenobacter sp.]MBK9489877.1 hypothetical protein [Haliscomenobacter sp.]